MENVPLAGLSQPGRLYDVGEMLFGTGGAVSNTGLALQQLGIDVRLMAAVGDDILGQAIISLLTARAPELARSISMLPGGASSYSIVLSPAKVDRIFLHCSGTNGVFDSNSVNYDEIARAKILHVGYPPLLPRLIASDGDELERLYRRAKSTGVITSLDTSLPDPNGFSGRVDWRTILSRTLPYVDIFVPSIEEIMFMLRRADYDRWLGRALEFIDADYLDAVAEEIASMGNPAIVGFKLGEMGVYLRSADAERLALVESRFLQSAIRAHQRAWHPAFEVEVVGTTGAGDSAYAGLLAALVRGLSLEEAARWSCAVGACNVEASDATSAIRSWRDTEARLNAGWRVSTHQLRGL
jgi:sugar/nucleoside kinase (ribokinase family)